MICVLVRKVGTILSTQLSSPYFDNKHKPNAQPDTPCNTPASCIDNGVLPPHFSVQNGGNTNSVYIGISWGVKCGFVIQ